MYVMGYPLGEAGAPIMAAGVLAKYRTSSSPPVGVLMNSDIAGASGSSGSPIFDPSGWVIGIQQSTQYDWSLTSITGISSGITSGEFLNEIPQWPAPTSGCLS